MTLGDLGAQADEARGIYAEYCRRFIGKLNVPQSEQDRHFKLVFDWRMAAETPLVAQEADGDAAVLFRLSGDDIDSQF